MLERQTDFHSWDPPSWDPPSPLSLSLSLSHSLTHTHSHTHIGDDHDVCVWSVQKRLLVFISAFCPDLGSVFTRSAL